MSNLDICRRIDLPPALARDTAISILRSINDGIPPYDNVALSLGLRKLGLPVGAEVRVPIDVTSTPAPLRWECRIHIEAEKRSGLFPRFKGTVSITPVGFSECELWVQGTYEPPFGALGAGADVTVMRGAAKESLEQFAKWLAGEIKRVVDKTERERVARR